MKERPILFSGAMVRAILEGRKTQTRRVINSNAFHFPTQGSVFPGARWEFEVRENGLAYTHIDNPNWWHFDSAKKFCDAGDRLWVRETHFRYGKWVKSGLSPTGRQNWRFKATTDEVLYFDNSPDNVRPNEYRKEGWYKRPSIFLPRWASRILLEASEVRVELVQEITRDDARAEGVSNRWSWSPDRNPELFARGLLNPYIANFSVLWDSLYRERGYGWVVNPWVWVVEFEQCG